jgi:flagellar hook assembly protein FlgD
VASTGVGHETPPGTVTEFELEQNYPNPFNPVTVIRFLLPEPAPVSLSIYDLQGRLVRTLLKPGRIEAGVHSAVWDGTNDSGNQVPSGIYFCRLTAGNYKQTKKMLILY